MIIFSFDISLALNSRDTLFVYATTNIQRLYKISNLMTKNLTQSYIKIHVTIISLVDSD